MCYTIEEIRNKVTPIAKAYGIRRMSLFGSYARGEANDDSDVDIYIEKGKLKSLLQYFSFIDELEKELECHVDVVTTGISDVTFLKHITEEGVLLYEEH
ncbi:MAG: nucleotidyltransferase family protein [Lachnospiraceae bacterium]